MALSLGEVFDRLVSDDKVRNGFKTGEMTGELRAKAHGLSHFDRRVGL